MLAVQVRVGPPQRWAARVVGTAKYVHVPRSVFGSVVPIALGSVPVAELKPSMSVAEYASHRGCSDSYVRRMRREDRLVLTKSGAIDVAASDASLANTGDPLRGGDRTKPAAEDEVELITVAAGDISLREAMRRERLARARLAELELGEEAKQLTRVKQVDREVFTLARQALVRLSSIPSRLRTSLAKETDPRACEALLDAEVAQVCQEMQKAVAALFAERGTSVPVAEAA